MIQHRPNPRSTTLLGGLGVLLGVLCPVVLTVPNLFPFPREILFLGNPVLQLLSSIIVAIAFGILAFGIPPEVGVTGSSALGSWALFAFGAHQLILDLAGLLTTGSVQPAAFIGGYVSLGLAVLGAVACLIAAVCVIRGGTLHGYGRWALIPVAITLLLSYAVSLAPIQEIAILSFQIGALYFLLLAAAGVAYAFHGQGDALRRRLHVINEWW